MSKMAETLNPSYFNVRILSLPEGEFQAVSQSGQCGAVSYIEHYEKVNEMVLQRRRKLKNIDEVIE